MRKQRFRTGGKVGEARTDADHQIGLRCELIRCHPSSYPNASEVKWVVTNQRSLSGLSFGKRQLQRFNKRTKRLMRAGISYPAAAYHQRTAFAGNQRPRHRQTLWVGRSTFNQMNAARKETLWIVPGFSLYILWQADGHGTSICGVSKRSHRV